MQTESIIEATGGMSLFQFIIMNFTIGPMILMGWGMLMMTFAGSSPVWWCVSLEVPVVGGTHEVNVSHLNNITAESCLSLDNTTCRFIYSQDKNTIVSEWNLVCDESKTPAFVTSMQMFGVMAGAFIGGQAADIIGRKTTFFLSLLLEMIFNLVAGFSVSWQMFTAVRFFIGMSTGSLLVVNHPYFMEFVPLKWRPICSSTPFWTVGVCTMALSSWLRPDWSHQHFILSAVHVPFLLGWFIVPESMRWLAVKGRIDEAEQVVDQICRYNKKEKPGNTRMLLKQIAELEMKYRESGRKYTYLDVYRGWGICWKSLVVQLVWACMALVYYGISLGAGKLSGILYLNIFLLSVIGAPGAVATFFLNNRIGRRWTSFLFFSLAAMGSVGIIITSRVGPGDHKGAIITALAIICNLGVGGAWSSFQLLSSEIYPTVMRNLGYGAANTAARIGGIIAPYIFAVDGKDVMIPFIIVGSAMATCAMLSLVMRETKGTPLEDTIFDRNINAEEMKVDEETDIFHTQCRIESTTKNIVCDNAVL